MANPTADPARASQQRGVSLASLIMGPLVSVALAAGAAVLALGSCSERVEVLEGPGKPAVVVASERRFVGKSSWVFTDLRADDGSLWTARSDPETIPVFSSGYATKIFRSGENDSDSRHPRAYIAAERDSELSAAKVGRGVLLVVSPLILLVGILVTRADLRSWRARRKE